MGAGQIGGIATLLDIDFQNAPTFLGHPAEATEAQYVVHYLSHAMMFCMGVFIEAHVILTPAMCVQGERYKFSVVAGTHMFQENAGIGRLVNHLCIHRGYNSSERWNDCSTDNIALLVLEQQFSFNKRELGTEYLLNRIRYGIATPKGSDLYVDTSCKYYGWGSRRNNYLIPLLIQLRRMDVVVLPREQCLSMFNYQEKFLCIQQSMCRSSKFGALCPDDVGSVIVCSGFAQGMMVSRLVDRPCGIGFLDLSKYVKFLTCGVDDSRDLFDDDDYRMDLDFDLTEAKAHTKPTIFTVTPELAEESTITDMYIIN